MLKTIARLFKDYKPFAFFSIVAAILMVFALVLLVPVLMEFYRTGLVPRLPTFVAACFMALFSLQSFICGLILDTQGKLNRQSFEVQLNILQQLADRTARPEESSVK